MPLYGWIPSSPGGDVVDAPSSQASGQFTFRVSPPDLDLSPSLPSSPATSPSESLHPASTSHPTGPERIPRPKNAFIIFRTEFARLRLHNAQGSPRSRRGVPQPVGRTVSGKAADVWHSLPPEEKQRYQRLAELEKEQHARDHPTYQYRPRRREGAPAPKRRRPSPALTIRTSHATPSSSDALSLSPPAEHPPSSPEFGLPSLIDPKVKADRRRSSSVPVTSGEHLLTSNHWSAEEPYRWDRQEMWEQPHKAKRRSRSVTQEWASMAPSFQHAEPIYFDPRSPKLAHFSPSIYPTSFAFDPPPKYMSPLTAVASSLAKSSLAGWNGEPAATMTPMAPQPMRLLVLPWLTEHDPALKFEPPSPEFDLKDPLTPLAGDFAWPPDPTAQYIFDASAGSSVHGKHPEGLEDYTRAQAMQEYHHGLQERVRDQNCAFFSELQY